MAKFLSRSARTISKIVAMLAIILLGISLFATRMIPEQHEDDKDWTVWRDLDFSVSVVSLFFASCLLYGTISEFRLFVLVWMPWNVLLIAFWVIFVVWKYDELLPWERIFRMISVILMVLGEIPVYIYSKTLKKRNRDPETAKPPVQWTPNKSNQIQDTPVPEVLEEISEITEEAKEQNSELNIEPPKAQIQDSPIPEVLEEISEISGEAKEQNSKLDIEPPKAQIQDSTVPEVSEEIAEITEEAKEPKSEHKESEISVEQPVDCDQVTKF